MRGVNLGFSEHDLWLITKHRWPLDLDSPRTGSSRHLTSRRWQRPALDMLRRRATMEYDWQRRFESPRRRS